MNWIGFFFILPFTSNSHILFQLSLIPINFGELFVRVFQNEQIFCYYERGDFWNFNFRWWHCFSNTVSSLTFWILWAVVYNLIYIHLVHVQSLYAYDSYSINKKEWKPTIPLKIYSIHNSNFHFILAPAATSYFNSSHMCWSLDMLIRNSAIFLFVSFFFLHKFFIIIYLFFNL